MCKFLIILLTAISLGCSTEHSQAPVSSDYWRTEQDRILVELIALNDPNISYFAERWGRNYRNPVGKDVSSLRIQAQLIKNDLPVWSAEYGRQRSEQEARAKEFNERKQAKTKP